LENLMKASRKSLNLNHVFPIALYCLMCVGWISAGEQGKEEKMETTATFAQKAGIRTDPISENEYGVISVPWDEIIDTISHGSSGDVLKSQRPIVETASVVSKCWKMRISDSDISFTAYVSTNYHESVMWMLHKASQTTMMTIPFIKSDPQVGNVSLITTHKNVCTYWVYRNVCMELTCTQSSIDLLHFAEKIQKALPPFSMQQCQVFSPMLEVNKNEFVIKQGEALVLKFKKDPSVQGFFIDFFKQGASITVTGINRDEIKITGGSPGKSKVTIMHGDPKTLLSNAIGIGFTTVE